MRSAMGIRTLYAECFPNKQHLSNDDRRENRRKEAKATEDHAIMVVDIGFSVAGC